MERKERLTMFLAFLKEKINFNFDKDCFEDRIKLQKYVHIARSCGLDLGYKFNLYLRGPYSPDLAKDYYELSLPACDLAGLDNFDSEKFLKIVKDRDLPWLEIASTILSVKETNPQISEARLTAIVAEIKNTDENRVEEILSDLKSAMC
ncbi:MAG: hypothetical protein H5T49_00490 [Hadesarchaea archaeon]|nr:hypothetical protein [Hadesarchaea archaeon]